MPDLKLTFACGPYDRFEAIRDGSIRAEGIELDYRAIRSPREIFDRMVLRREFDVSELSASEFITLHCAKEKSPFVAIPVFPSKVFRHSYIYVNANSGIRAPKDLEGKRVGVPLITMTAAIWIRGMLAEDHGVDMARVRFVQGSMHETGAHGEERGLVRLPGIEIEQNRTGRPLDELLAAGEIDAFMGPQTPTTLGKGQVVRLFPDFEAREKDYFRRTHIHPIMHLVAIRREVYDANPWIAPSLTRAFTQAKDLAWKHLRHSGAHTSMLPWVYAHVQETADVMGDDPWPYGIEANRPTLEALVRYLHQQGLIARIPPLEELFVAR